MTQTMIDPPSGWRYGFPKPIPEDQLGRTREWLVENGYPQSEIDALGDRFYYRCWVHDNSSDEIRIPPMLPGRREDHFLDIKGAVGVGIVVGLLTSLLAEILLDIKVPAPAQFVAVCAVGITTYWLLRKDKP